ncbi:hypothetical protein B0H12DRAFT_427809 [Mycena haematopus]|nr:hypothetical protein B0H12DRAFT_427809 [Mycena haematopus]
MLRFKWRATPIITHTCDYLFLALFLCVLHRVLHPFPELHSRPSSFVSGLQLYFRFLGLL